MKLFAMLALLAAPTLAFAGAPQGTATFRTGEAPAKLIANDNIWRCDGGTCRGAGEERPVAVMRVCKDLARRIGAVETLSVGATALDPAQLADCNRVARRTDEGEALVRR